MSDNKLDKIMADLINEANTLSAARTVFISLNKNIDLINQQQTGYSTFFAVVIDICRQCLFLSTVKIFDMAKHSSSLKSLKEALSRDDNIDKDKADELVKKIDDFLKNPDIAETLDRIREIRHQSIAHKQTEAEQKAEDRTYNEFYGLIDKTFLVLDQVADGIDFHENKRITKGSPVKKSIQRVLDTLFPKQ